MDIKTLALRLRHAADVLDELLETPGTPAIARQLLHIKTKPRGKARHWTQRPENKARLRKILKRAARAKRVKANGTT
jgi:hypothetical protein